MSKIFKDTVENIKSNGFRITSSRRAIVKILCNAKIPITATQILNKLLDLKLETNRITIYRELCFLTENDFAQKIQLADHKMYYEISAEHHHHLICTKCRLVKKIILGNHLEKQEQDMCKKEKFKSVTHSLEFYGVCKRCA